MRAPPTGNAALDSMRRRVDTTATAMVRHAFPRGVRLLPLGGLQIVDSSAELQRGAGWERLGGSDSLILTFPGWPVWGRLSLLESGQSASGMASMYNNDGGPQRVGAAGHPMRCPGNGASRVPHSNSGDVSTRLSMARFP
jgi:hypothetical protein